LLLLLLLVYTSLLLFLMLLLLRMHTANLETTVVVSYNFSSPNLIFDMECFL
jgi:hypothetical protein